MIIATRDVADASTRNVAYRAWQLLNATPMRELKEVRALDVFVQVSAFGPGPVAEVQAGRASIAVTARRPYQVDLR